jgi:fructose-specific phosphotransferase system IIA component
VNLLNNIEQSCIQINLKSISKNQVINELVEILIKAGKLKNKKQAMKDILDREEKGSTGLEQGIAIPHAKTSSVKELLMVIGISKKGIDFDALDEKPSSIFFLLLSSPDSPGTHIEALSAIAGLISESSTREKLKKALAPEDIMNIIKEHETKQ